MTSKSTRFEDIQNQFDKYEKHRDIFKKINYLYSERKKPETKSFQNAITTILSPLEIWKYLFSSFDIQSLKTMRDQSENNFSVIPFSAKKLKKEEILFRMDYFLTFCTLKQKGKRIDSYKKIKTLYYKIITNNSLTPKFVEDIYNDDILKDFILSDGNSIPQDDKDLFLTGIKKFIAGIKMAENKDVVQFPFDNIQINQTIYSFCSIYRDSYNSIVFKDLNGNNDLKITFIRNLSDIYKSIVIFESTITDNITISEIGPEVSENTDVPESYTDIFKKIRESIETIYNISKS